ncbi:MAG: heme-binding protein [Solidesulfovibrio sp.]
MRSSVTGLILAVGMLFCMASTQSWAGPVVLNLKSSLPMIAAAEKKAAEIGVPMVITVLDAGGNMIAQHRMDEALLVSVEISANKAYTALALKMPTDKLGTLAQPGQSLYGIQNSSRVIIFGGGFPVTADGKFIGAIGVSGGSVEQDMACAKAGLAALQ